MGGDIPGKPLVVIGVLVGAVLMFVDLSETLSYVAWGIAIVAVVLGLLNWTVR